MSETLTPQVITRLQTYLRKAFGTQTLSVRAQPKKKDVAEVYASDKPFGTIIVDDEDDEVTYQFAWTIKEKPQPLTVPEMVRIQTYLRQVLGAKTLSIRARGKLKDSAEVFVAEESLAILSADGDAYEFQMAILEMDLEGIM
jgi:Protein of unknown function (DUF3126)